MSYVLTFKNCVKIWFILQHLLAKECISVKLIKDYGYIEIYVLFFLLFCLVIFSERWLMKQQENEIKFSRWVISGENEIAGNGGKRLFLI